MSMIVPTLLNRANSEGEQVYRETSARLLDLASSDQAAFRVVIGTMNENQKVFLEVVIKAGQGGGGQQKVDDGEGREPTIALKMNFGNA